MKRKAYQDLLDWKNSPSRKPLVVEGARQVGKTWLLKEFGKNEYQNLVYINCDNNEQLNQLFFDYDMERIVRGLSALSQTNIQDNNTLIVFDEIQESAKALTSLKYFYENRPDLHVAVAGSLLGLSIHSGTGFPVGCVNKLNLYPLSFMEFLDSSGNELIKLAIEQHDWENLNTLLPKITELLRQYYYVGGMPEVVESFIQTNDIQLVRKKQLEILDSYKLDISKHSNIKDIPKIFMVWNSIPSQLAKENKKFLYGSLKTGARAKDFENSIQWLVDAGLVYKISRTKKIEMPLKYYEDFSAFKLFMLDLGLFGAMSETPAADILLGNNVFSCYKGSFTEQYVCQQYVSSTNSLPFYYSNNNSTMEIDFLSQKSSLYAIEVKAEENLKSKSLKTVLNENETLKGIRLSMSGFKEQERITNYHLGFAGEFFSTQIH